MRRSQQSNPEFLRQELIELLSNFQNTLAEDDLRTKVQALVPVIHTVADLGSSLIPVEVASSGRERMLHYFTEYPFVVIPGDELRVVAGIDDWARRVRELRTEMGWAILSGKAAQEMESEKDLEIPDVNIQQMKGDDYILVNTKQDRDAAYRWKVANEIRRENSSVKNKILKFLQSNLGRLVTGEELRYVANDRTEWARRVRELRTEDGWPVVTKTNGRPDLPVGVYILEQNRQSPPHDRKIPDEVRGIVLSRDAYQCRRCNWRYSLWDPSDPRNLELHHIKPHANKGENTADNLITLCTVCHDVWHSLSSANFDDWLETGVSLG